MILQRTRSQGCSILTVGGVVKLGESAQFFAQSLDQALAEDSGHLIIDFSQINYIDSTGIGELVGYLARFKERGRKLILVHPAERLQKLLAVAGLLFLPNAPYLLTEIRHFVLDASFRELTARAPHEAAAMRLSALFGALFAGYG
nr:DUF1361 domain-containing protein [Thermoanaerobaculia bacterium]